MTEEYVEEDKMKAPLTDLSNWISTTAIPEFFKNEDLQSNITLNLNVSTLNNYISNVIFMLKEKFMKHCDW